MIAWILGYLLVGEIFAVAFTSWMACFNNRFVAAAVRPAWRDLRIYLAVQLLWPATIFVLFPLTIRLWRRAVQNEICVCGHRRASHLDDGSECLHATYRAQWVVSGEGPDLVQCNCPKFTLPNVRPRR